MNAIECYFILLAILVAAIMTIIGLIKKTFNPIKILAMDPKPLTYQSLFWISILSPLISFIYFGQFTLFNTDLDLSAKGFKRFIELAALPLGLLSLSIPFFSIINNIHRTIQTNKQIFQTEKKNNFDLLYSHRKSFIDYIESRELNEFTISLKYAAGFNNLSMKIEIISSYYIYKKIFHENETNENITFKESLEYIKKLDKLWSIANESLSKFSSNNSDKKYEELAFNIFQSLEIMVFDLIELLNLRLNSERATITIDFITTKYNTEFISNSYLKYIIKSLYNLTIDIYIYTNYKYEPKPYVSEYIDNPSFNISYIPSGGSIFSHNNEFIGLTPSR